MRTSNFHLPRINRKATRKAVEEELYKLQTSLMTISESYESKVTSSVELVPIKPVGQFRSNTEETAIKNVELRQQKKDYIDSVLGIINRLPDLERQVIIKEYLDDPYKFNYEIYCEIGISKTYYYRLKGRAFYNLALMLGVEVYVYQEKVSS